MKHLATYASVSHRRSSLIDLHQCCRAPKSWKAQAVRAETTPGTGKASRGRYLINAARVASQRLRRRKWRSRRTKVAMADPFDALMLSFKGRSPISPRPTG